MDDHATGDERPTDVPQRQNGADPAASIEAYETEDGVVLYDAQNPLAWLQSTRAVTIAEQL